MSKHNIIKYDPTIPAKFADWFGAPAVLTDEELQIYKKMLCGVYQDVKPQDFIEFTLVEDYAYNLFRRVRLRRRLANFPRQVYSERFERDERELLQEGERRKQEVRRLFDLEGPIGRRRGGRDPLLDTKCLMELEMNELKMKKQLAEIDAETNEKLAKLQKAKEAPIDEVACFDQWIDKEERTNEELAEVDRSIHVTRKALDEHRTGLGQRLRQVPDEIVDVEFAEVTVPSCEEPVAQADAPANTESKEDSTGTIVVLSVAKPPAPASVNTNGGAPTKLDAPATSTPPPSSGPAEQQ
jgi:hypothetical protein